MKRTMQKAFVKSLPVMAGYVVLGIGFGILLKEAGYGFFWSFLRSVDEAFPGKPEGYSEEKVQELLGRYQDEPIPENERVNVVFTMLESYSDLSVFDSINFTADPYADFH
ncbi:MAG: hypothetical protein IIX10_06745, partial [Clostridia bacterium]|nr:hypothetical protein [Clostridia bacterium]